MPENTKKELIEKFALDDRIIYLGWKKADELKKYLLAGDLYAQPGTASSTLQQAICCGLPVMLKAWEDEFSRGYKFFLDDDKVFFVDTEEDIFKVFQMISQKPKILEKYKEYSYEYAYELFDYKKQVEKLREFYEDYIKRENYV